MKAVHVQEPEGLEGIEGLVYEDAPDPGPPSRVPSARSVIAPCYQMRTARRRWAHVPASSVPRGDV
jgi:hypothetical protein